MIKLLKIGFSFLSALILSVFLTSITFWLLSALYVVIGIYVFNCPIKTVGLTGNFVCDSELINTGFLMVVAIASLVVFILSVIKFYTEMRNVLKW